MSDPIQIAQSWLHGQGVGAGDDVAVSISHGGFGLASASGSSATRLALESDTPGSVIATLEASIGPRWVWWDRTTADVLAVAGVGVRRCWDLVTVHRLLHGGWRTGPAAMWAWLHDLPVTSLPVEGQFDLSSGTTISDRGDHPVRPDGHLRPDWVNGSWQVDAHAAATWAELALECAGLQRSLLAQRPSPLRAESTARAESAAEFLCAELTLEGLPIDRSEAERIIAEAAGPRPEDDRQADIRRRERDDVVLKLLPDGPVPDLRNPTDVRSMLRRVGVDVPDTRAGRIERHRHTHPVVEALLHWRKAERLATTYGYRWLDERVQDGRLRGEWSSCDGAAGRMTASAGLHNLPAEMRPAVVAEVGHVFVRADLGQIEPRVLAAVSGDEALIVATSDDDLYAPIASRLGVTRERAKVAVLGAMYGSTTGTSAEALRGLQREFPVAMALLEHAAGEGRAGNDLVTVGGRLVRMWVDEQIDGEGRGDLDHARSVAAARGRYARNAVIQGAAAELFKVWAVTTRARVAELEARIVLCLHDELLVHCREEVADQVVIGVEGALQEAATRWSPSPGVRFVADSSVVRRWSDAK